MVIRLLVIADDLTGALDTGAQFAKANVPVRVSTNVPCSIGPEEQKRTCVLVVNAQSRHLPPAHAAERIATIVRLTHSFAPDLYYKKTDSVLRGNIGAEIESLMKAVGARNAYFAPAFPENGRTTKDGVQYVHGVPLVKTIFGRDPFDPVKHSDVRAVIAEQSATPVTLVQDKCPEEGIALFSAETNEDMRTAAKMMRESGARVLAGCAGLAGVLADVYNLSRMEFKQPALPQRTLVLSGSLHPVTARQLRYARQQGIYGISLCKEQLYCPQYLRTSEGRLFSQRLVEQAQQQRHLLIEVADMSLTADKIDHSTAAREIVSYNIGSIGSALVHANIPAVYVFTGGDTLMAVMQQLGTSFLRPIAEILPGLVLSETILNGQSLFIVSKSGGFGPDDTFMQIITYLEQHVKGEQTA